MWVVRSPMRTEAPVGIVPRAVMQILPKPGWENGMGVYHPPARCGCIRTRGGTPMGLTAVNIRVGGGADVCPVAQGVTAMCAHHGTAIPRGGATGETTAHYNLENRYPRFFSSDNKASSFQ
jgi:hypothetical protein